MLIIFLNLNLYQKKIICKKNNNNYNKKILNLEIFHQQIL